MPPATAPALRGAAGRLQLPPLARVLRRPRVVVGELTALALLAAAGAVIPQRGGAGGEAPAVAARLGLDHVFTSWPFVLVALACTASLASVSHDLLRRLVREWRHRPDPGRVRRAPLRVTFIRPATGRGSWARRRGRLGLAGSPAFHLGLLLVAVAGLLRALAGSAAVADVIAGEVLPPRPEAWAAQWPGALGRRFALREPLRLRAVHAEYSPGGDLRSLAADLVVGGRPARIAINRPLRFGSRRVWLDQRHGRALLLEAGTRRLAILARHRPGEADLGRAAVGGGELRVRVAPSGAAALRLLRGETAVWVGSLAPGESVLVPGLGRVVHHGVRPWVRLQGGHDPFLSLLWVGVALAVAGLSLLFTVVPADVAVVVEPAGEVERVTVAVRPRRFAPLARPLLDRLVEAEGGGPGG